MGTVSHRLVHKEPYCADESMKSTRRKPNTWEGSGHVMSRGGGEGGGRGSECWSGLGIDFGLL